MISLDQVQKLEKKVNDAVDLINRLKSEKSGLEEKVLQYEMKILELEEMAERLNKDQNEIEDKIIGALNQLEDLDSEKLPESVSTEETAETHVPAEESEPSADFSASDDLAFVETESAEPDDEVVNSENEGEGNEEPLSEDDNQSELQEDITEDPQDGITAEEETVEEEVVPTVDSQFGEMPEDENKKPDNPEVDLFEQSLDIF